MKKNRTENIKKEEMLEVADFTLNSFASSLEEALEELGLDPDDYTLEDGFIDCIMDLMSTGQTAIVLFGTEDDILVLAHETDKGLSFDIRQVTVVEQYNTAKLFDVVKETAL